MYCCRWTAPTTSRLTAPRRRIVFRLIWGTPCQDWFGCPRLNVDAAGRGVLPRVYRLLMPATRSVRLLSGRTLSFHGVPGQVELLAELGRSNTDSVATTGSARPLCIVWVT